jgi:hypothetical protein
LSAQDRREPLFAFDGPVECRRETGTVNLILRGRERVAAGAPLEALFGAATADGALAHWPDTLHAVQVFGIGETGPPRRFELRSQELSVVFAAHTLQVHRDPGAAFFAVVPAASVPPLRRGLWNLLLSLLRLPGAGRLLAWWRGAR